MGYGCNNVQIIRTGVSFRAIVSLMVLKLRSLLVVLPIILLAAAAIQAQPPETPAKRLKNPAVVRGFIGGESHDSYVIRAAKGKTMTVQISWRREGDNGAGFEITEGTRTVGSGTIIAPSSSPDSF